MYEFGHDETRDLKLIVGNVQFHTHRGVLASFGGTAIRTMVELNMAEDSPAGGQGGHIMTIPEDEPASAESWKIVLEHVYSRAKEWTPERAATALRVIDKYGFDELIPGMAEALGRQDAFEFRTPELAEQLVRLSPETVRKWFYFRGSLATTRRTEHWLNVLQFSLSCIVQAQDAQVRGGEAVKKMRLS